MLYADGKTGGSVNLGQFVLVLIFVVVHLKVYT